MSRFVLTAQIQLQAPGNSRDVLRQIRRDLGSGRPVSIPIEIAGVNRAQTQIRQITRETELATGAAEALGRSFGLAIRRFAAFTVASRAVSLFTNSFANAVDDAIDFQREIVKISQVTGDSIRQLRSLQTTVTNLSVSLGTSSKDLLAVTRIFSQAGIRGRDLEVALSGIAKTTLAPTFENITATAEGAVAILSQFQSGVRSLEGQLGSINAVAGKFAVESDDLIGAVRRFGGVFKASGGSLEELLAVFTSVRATTRESAESIATGLRTVFTRIQRPATIKFLEDLGIKLTDLNGRFVGPFEAAQRLGQALEGLTEGDTRFIAVAEELGGFRQIGKVIPLIRQYKLAQEALTTAQEGTNSLTKDSETAQQALAVQITKVREEFFALVRGIADTTTFQVFVKTTLSLASAFIKVADALKPILPLIAAVAAFRFARGLGNFIGGIGAAVSNVQRRSTGGSILAFADGGVVPGSGNRDTVPAMLTPGEFVIRKSSVAKIGTGALAAMNENRYNGGGPVKPFWEMTPEEQEEARKRFQAEEDERAIQKSIAKMQSNTWRDEDLRRGRYKGGYKRRYNGGGSVKPFWEMTPEEQEEARRKFQEAEDERAIQKSIARMQSNTWRDEDLRSNRRGRYGGYKRYNTGGFVDISDIREKLSRSQDLGGLAGKESTQQLSAAGRTKTGVGRVSLGTLGDPKALQYAGIFLGPLGTEKSDFQGSVEGNAILKKIPEIDQFKKISEAKFTLPKTAGGEDVSRSSPEYQEASKRFDLEKKAILDLKKKQESKLKGKQFPFSVKAVGVQEKYVNTIENNIIGGLLDIIKLTSTQVAAQLGQKIPDSLNDPAAFLKDINVDNMVGNLFEGVIARLGTPFGGGAKDEANAPFDFPQGVPDQFLDIFEEGNKIAGLPTEAKAKYNSNSLESFISKIKNEQAKNKAVEFANLFSEVQIPQMLAIGSTTSTSAKKVVGGKAVQRFNKGSSGRGVKGFGPHRQPLIDDLKNTPDALLPNPSVAIPAMLSSGSASLDLDRTLFRTIGDQAYMNAKTDKQRSEVIERYFRDPATRLNDVRTAKLTQFGQELQQLVKNKEIDPSNLSIISKSADVPGLKDYVSQVFGIPPQNMEFTSGGEKNTALDRNRVYGPASKRKLIKKASGGGINSSDTVPALLTPGEFVINRDAAQQIGYGNLNRMNKRGVVGFNKGGKVGLFDDLDTNAPFRPKAGLFNDLDTDDPFRPRGRKKTAEFLEKKGLQEFLQAASKIDPSDGKSLNPVIKELITKSTKSDGQTVDLKKYFNEGNDPARLISQLREQAAKSREGVQNFMPGSDDAFGGGKSTALDLLASKLEELKSERDDECKCANLIVKAIQDLQKTNESKQSEIVKSGTSSEAAESLEGDDSENINRSLGSGFAGTFLAIGAVSAAANAALENFAKTTAETSAAQALVNDVLKNTANAATSLAATLTTAKAAIDSNLIRDKKGNLTGKTKLGESVSGFGQGLERGRFKIASKPLQNFGGLLNKVGSFLPKVLSGFNVAAVAFTTAGVIATTMAGSFQRAADKAVELGDASSAAENIANAEWWNYINDNFLTVSGLLGQLGTVFSYVGGLFSSSAGNINAFSEASEKATRELNKKIAEGAVQATKNSVDIVLSGLERGGDLDKKGSAGFDEGASRVVANIAEANRRVQDVRSNSKDVGKANELQRTITENFQRSVTSFANRGAEDEQIRSLTTAYKDATPEVREVAERFVELTIASREASKSLIAAKFDTLKITSAFSVAAASTKAFSDSLVTGSNALQGYVDQLSAARGVVGFDATNLINSIESELISSVSNAGGSGVSDLNKSIARQAAAARGANAFSNNVGSIINNLDISKLDPGNAIKRIEDALSSAVPAGLDEDVDRAIRSNIANIVSKINVLEGTPVDLSEIIKDVVEASSQLYSGLDSASQVQIAHNQKITELYKEREQIEERAIDSANSAIEAQIEAGKFFEQFGGKRLTENQQLSARIAQFNNVGQAGGLNVGLRTGDASDIRRVSAEIGKRFAESQGKSLTSIRSGQGFAFEGPRGVAEDKRDEARKADAQLIQFTKQRISLLQEELKIVEAKNKAEQDALDKLIGGDIEGFIADQAAAGAAAALRSGSSNLTNLFSSSALGAGFKTLKDQGLSDQELTKAAAGVLGRVGITDSSSAGILAGVSPEAEAIRAQGRELAGALGDIAQQQVAFDRSEIAINEATITASNLNFNEALSRTAEQNASRGFARGGVVYANKGMFVPRGTDTVPAMLTPGEFVVNRAAVRRGNNMQILRAMNSGGGASAPTHMKGGGQVNYYNTGGMVDAISSAFSNALPQLSNIFSGFSSAVDKLVTSQFSLRLDTTNINVNLNGGSFLEKMKEDVKQDLLDHISREIKSYKLNTSGDLNKDNSVLGK